MIKVLFLSAWYPNRYDAMFGLFVRKHAEAVGRCAEVRVLYVHADQSIRDFQIENRANDNLSETIVYYPALNFFQKLVNYLRAYQLGFELIRSVGFVPDIVHANILTRTGLMAQLFAGFHKIPYVISEHWSRYLPGRNGYNGFLRKIISKIVVNGAAAVIPVSEVLKQGLISKGLNHNNFRIIGNVVEDIFYEQNKKSNIEDNLFHFLHISCFDEQAKNISGILRAASRLSSQRSDFRFTIIGTGKDFSRIYQLAESLSFPENMLNFTGEQTPEEVSRWFSQSDCFVLFSNYETAGIVISESMASGIPVISTKAGIATTDINDETGILIDCGDENALLHAMSRMIDNKHQFSAERIRMAAQKYSYAAIGSQMLELYQEILNLQKK